MKQGTIFVPVLSVSSGITDIEFYKNAFGAEQQWRINNPDGTVHVAAFLINGTQFRLHEEGSRTPGPDKINGTTVTIGMEVDDVNGVMERAVTAGAVITSPAKEYEYGYRQGEIRDPFGHCWLIEKLFNPGALDNFVRNA